jgi:3',5'-cyclic AMP phosphodiesterase CpdA
MSEKLTFVHLTDLHVGDPAVPDPGLQADTTANLRAILADVKRLTPAPAFMVVSGDLTNRGDAGSYRAVKALFAEATLSFPVFFALGNHDRREPFYEVMLDRSNAGGTPYDHDALIGDIHLIVLDTSIPGAIGGGFEPGQLDWLKERLDAHPARRKLLVMHHAPMLDPDEPATAWESITAEDTHRLATLLAGRRDILGILSGHIHYDRVSHWYGIPIVTGIGQHAAVDVLSLHQGLRSVAGASFIVGKVRESGLTVAFAPQPSDRRELASISWEGMAALIERFDGAVRG